MTKPKSNSFTSLLVTSLSLSGFLWLALVLIEPAEPVEPDVLDSAFRSSKVRLQHHSPALTASQRSDAPDSMCCPAASEIIDESVAPCLCFSSSHHAFLFTCSSGSLLGTCKTYRHCTIITDCSSFVQLWKHSKNMAKHHQVPAHFRHLWSAWAILPKR